jgi:tape measure domain-containing protein
MARIVVDEVVTKYTMDPDGFVRGTTIVKQKSKELDAAATATQGSFGDIGQSVKFATAEFDSAIPGLQEIISLFKIAGVAVVGMTAAMIAFGAAAANQNADLEAIRMGYAAYSDGAEDAAIKLKRLEEVARLPGLGFEEAIQGATRLRAVGFDARLAERALMGFGNALALVGGGKNELDRVILALSQIQSKGKVSAEEINQIAEVVPQIRQLMKDAFGTGDTEAIAKKFGSQEFILGIMEALDKLPAATGGAKNAFENMGDAIKRIMDQAGEAINRVFVPAINEVTKFGDFLSSENFFGKAVDQMMTKFSGFSNQIMGMIGGFASSPITDAINSMGSFVASGDSFGDKLVRGATLLVVAFEKLPEVVGIVLKMVQDNLKTIQGLVNVVISAFNKLMTEGLTGNIGWMSVKIGGDKNFTAIPQVKLGEVDTNKFGALGMGIVDQAKELYGDYKNYQPSNMVGNDPSKGGFEKTDTTLQAIAENTKRAADSLGDLINNQILGGGALSRIALNRQDISDLHTGRSAVTRNEAEEMMLRGVRAMVQLAAIDQRAPGRREA